MKFINALLPTKKQKIIASAVLGLGLLTVAINPRAGIADGGVVAVSCSTKHLLLTKAMDQGYQQIPAGIYSPERLTKKVVANAMSDYTVSTAGNPFAGLGIALLGSMSGTVQNLWETAVDDACNGGDIAWLTTMAQGLGSSR